MAVWISGLEIMLATGATSSCPALGRHRHGSPLCSALGELLFTGLLKTEAAPTAESGQCAYACALCLLWLYGAADP